jgi:membrane protease YdiL (CAAX protease family)
VKPRLPTVWDKVFVILVLVTAIVVPLVVSSGIRNDITAGIFLYAISAAIIPPALEELINRGFIQSSLERLRYAQWLVVIVSSLIFSISHYPVNPEAVPVTLVAGILFGIMTIRTKSVMLPFLIHGVWNFIVTLAP